MDDRLLLIFTSEHGIIYLEQHRGHTGKLLTNLLAFERQP